MTRLWKMISLFICCFASAQAATTLFANTESNIAFIEKTIVDITAPLIDTLNATAVNKLVLSCKSRNDGHEAAIFLRDVISKQLLQAGFTVFLGNGNSLENNTETTDSGFLEIVLEEWRLTADKRKNEQSQKYINQEFGLQIRYRVMSSARQVLFTGTKSGANTKVFENMKSFRMAQEGQPAFAQANPSFATQKNNLVSTILISGVTAISIFLIYTLRSQ